MIKIQNSISNKQHQHTPVSEMELLPNLIISDTCTGWAKKTGSF